MRPVRRPTAALLILTALLAGCPTRQLLQAPEDAYRFPAGGASGDLVARANAAAAREDLPAEAGRDAWVLVREARDRGDLATVDRMIGRLERIQPESGWLPPAVWLRLQMQRESEGALRFLLRADEALARFPSATGFTGAVRELVPPALAACGQSDLETFLARSPEGPLAADVTLVLAKLQRARGEEEEAARSLRTLVARFPVSPASTEAFTMLRELSRKVPVSAHTVGALLPVTGRYAAYGLSVSQGATLALEELRAQGQEIEFVVRDTMEDPAAALRELEALVRERQVAALFGPLFSATALACAAEANALGVPLVTPAALSSRLTQTGPYVFRGAPTPEQQVAALARYAVESRGVRRFGIIAPDSAYGRGLSAAFTAGLIAAGGTVVAESRFPPGAADFDEAVVAVGGADISGYKERDEEFRRSAQAELETFLGRFFDAADAALHPGPSVPPAPGATPAETPPPPAAISVRAACLVMTPDPYTGELAQRLRAATLPHKSVMVLSPENATAFSANLRSADVPAEGPLAGTSELALAELLGQSAAARDAGLAVLISVDSAGSTESAETLSCVLAVYDVRSTRQIARHGFRTRRPISPTGNRFGLEALFVPAAGAQVLHLAPQLVYHNLALPIFGSDAWDDEALRKRPQDMGLEARFVASFWPELAMPRAAEFTRRYRERFASDPDALAASAYDALRLLADGIRRADGTREGLRAALAQGPAIEGLTGPLRITPQREAERTPVILQVSRDGIVPVQ